MIIPKMQDHHLVSQTNKQIHTIILFFLNVCTRTYRETYLLFFKVHKYQIKPNTHLVPAPHSTEQQN